MKDIQISGKKIKIELIILLIIIIISYLLNVFSIFFYKTQWTELFSSFFYVLAFAIAVYLLLIPIRILILMLISLFIKKNKIQSK
jgi:hypothetical protein